MRKDFDFWKIITGIRVFFICLCYKGKPMEIAKEVPAAVEAEAE